MRGDNPRTAQSNGQKATKRGESPRWKSSLPPGAERQLPPTAQRLLDAAHRLLVRSGYNSLSVEAIGREAGENKALIRYYFGPRTACWSRSPTAWSPTPSAEHAGGSPVSPTHTTVWEWSWRPPPTSSTMPPRTSCIRSLAPAPREPPHDQAVGRPLRRLPGSQRPLSVGRPPGEPPEAVRRLAAMTVALSDGLAVQMLAEPGSVDVRAARSPLGARSWNARWPRRAAAMSAGGPDKSA